MPPLIIAAAMAISEFAAAAASAAVVTTGTAAAVGGAAAAGSTALAAGATAAGAVSAATAALSAGVATTTTLASVAYGATALATSALLGMASDAVSGGRSAPGVQMRTASSALETRRIPCGKVWTGGRSMGNPMCWGASNKHAETLIAIADVPIGGIQSFSVVSDDNVTNTYNGFFVNGYPASFRQHDANKGYEIEKTVNPHTREKVKSYLTGKSFKFHVKFYFGDDDQTVDTWLLNHFDSERWDATAIGSGLAYARISAYYDSDIFDGLPSFNFYILGAKLYDPSKDTTVGGSGTHRWGDESTYEPTCNPAVIAYNIARGIYIRKYVNGVWTRVLYYGGGYEAGDLPLDYWITAIQNCDEEITDKDGTVSPRYTCSFEIDLTKPPRDYLSVCQTAMAGRIVSDRGQLLVYAGVAQTPVYTFGDSDLVVGAEQQYEAYLGLDALKNTVTAKFLSTQELFAQVDAPPRASDDDIAADGDIPLVDDMDLSMIQHGPTAQRVMEVTRQRHRAQGCAVRTLGAAGMNARTGEWVAGTSRSWVGTKWFEIIKAVPDVMKLTVTLSLREVPYNLGDWDATTDELDKYSVNLSSDAAVDPLEATGITANAVSEQGADGSATATLEIAYNVSTGSDDDDVATTGAVLELGTVALRNGEGISDGTTAFQDTTNTPFMQEMAGKKIAIDGAGDSGGQYSGTISTVNGSRKVTLSAAPATAGTGLTYTVINSTQYIYSDDTSTGLVTAKNLLGNTTYAYRLLVSGELGRSAVWSDWAVVTTSSTSLPDESVTYASLSAAVKAELEKITAQATALETMQAAATAQKNAADAALAQANAIVGQVALLAASIQQDTAASYQSKTDKISAVVDTASAAISDVRLAAASTTEAIAKLSTDVTAQLGTISGDISAIKTAYAAADQALTQTTDTLTAILAGYSKSYTVSAAIDDVKTAYAEADEVLASRISTTEAQLSGLDDTQGSVRSAIEDAATAYVTATDALAKRATSLESLLGGNASNAVLNAYTSSTATGAIASTELTLTATDGTNSTKAGIAADAVVENGVTYARVRIIGDRLLLSSPSDTTNSIYFDTNKNVLVFDNSTIMSVFGTNFGASSNLSVWIGSKQSALSACTTANSIFHVTKAGDAYFGGSLRAGTLVTSRTNVDTGSDVEFKSNTFSSKGGTILITMSYSYEASASSTFAATSEGMASYRTVWNALTGTTANASDDTQNYSAPESAKTIIDLYRSINGGAFTKVDSLEITGTRTVFGGAPSIGDHGGGIKHTTSMGGSITYTDPDASTYDRQYMAKINTRVATVTTGIAQSITLLSAEE